ncbi:hypothetical protein MMC07_005100 [Pseudocyphellaria aurata]|nr:hypothetical protein [Pseudocyphellaria aurata]
MEVYDEGLREANEEDSYSDDDLDAIPADTFHELQQNAIRSTQPQDKIAHSVSEPVQLPGPVGRVADPRNTANASNQSSTRNYAHQPSSDYGDFDDEMLDGEIFDAAEGLVDVAGREGDIMGVPIRESTQKEDFIQRRYGETSQLRGYGWEQRPYGDRAISNLMDRTRKDGFEDHDGTTFLAHGKMDEDPAQPPRKSSAADGHQAQIQELLRERHTLQEAVNSANELVSAKTGEIAVIRANQSKLEKENEQRLVALQKLRAEEAARYKIEIEKARAEQQKIAIEKQFLENDLDQGNKQIKSLQRVVKDGVGKTSLSRSEEGKNQVTTPKKNKSLPYGDGFDDDEIQTISPSKLSVRPKVLTPKAAGKRKRKVEENSPVKPLPLGQGENVDRLADPVQDSNIDNFSTLINSSQSNDNFKLIQKILNHRPRHAEKRSFEALASFAYSSNPTQALSTIFLDKLSALTNKPEIESFPAAFAQIIFSLWARCIDEKFVCKAGQSFLNGFPHFYQAEAKWFQYAPVYLLMDLIKVVLLIGPPGTAPLFPDEVIKYAQLTADINMIPRFKRVPAAEIKPEIDTNLCLQILHLMAYDCLRRKEDIERFWRIMRFDFSVMMLNVAQPIEELHIAISLLRTSVLETSFAMRVTPGDGTQGKSQEHVIERLTRLLLEVPLAMEGASPFEVAGITELRLQVLSLLEAMCDNKHGGEALATHKDVIGRLVRVMNDELGALYDRQYGHEQRCELVNQSTRLLFHLITIYSSLIDMQAKLRVIPGGTHKYLIALTRLAFSEGIFYEKGIEEDVVDFAHQMLETLVNPQEAEALLEAFSSVKSGSK